MAEKINLLRVYFWSLLFLLDLSCLATATPSGTRDKPKCLINTHPSAPDLVGVDYFDHVRTVQLPEGRTYRYVQYQAQGRDKPYLLFLHGFPDSSFLWRNQFEFFSHLGYGIIAPDLLGFGGSDKPADSTAYTLKKQATHITDILDCEGIDSFIGIGHDLGSPVLSRMHSYDASRVSKFAFLNVGFTPVPIPFTAAGIKAINEHWLETHGYKPFGYWQFFNQTGAGRLLDEHFESFYSLEYTPSSEFWKQYLGPPGALEAWLRAEKRAPPDHHIAASDEAVVKRIFDPARGGYEPTLNHYRALYRNENNADDDSITLSSLTIHQPVFLLVASQEVIAVPEFAINSTTPFAKDLRIKTIDTNHWPMLNRKEEVNELLKKFFEEKQLFR